jgi:hypothetical protein
MNHFDNDVDPMENLLWGDASDYMPAVSAVLQAPQHTARSHSILHRCPTYRDTE